MNNCNNCTSQKASCMPDCGSIGKLFGHAIEDQCEVLKIGPDSDIGVTWCGKTATFHINPCNMLQKNIVRGADCISTEVVQDPETGDCFVEISDSKRYFVNGVAFKSNYNGVLCNYNLSVVSSDNTVEVGQYNMGGGSLALDLKVKSRPQSAIFRDANGNECQVDTAGPIKFTFEDPCYEMECSPNFDGVTYRSISDIGINNVAFDCGRIFMSDPDGLISFTTNPDNDKEIFVQLDPGTIGLQTIALTCQSLSISGGNTVTLPAATGANGGTAHNFAYILAQTGVNTPQPVVSTLNVNLPCAKKAFINFLLDSGKFLGGVPYPSTPDNYSTGVFRFDLYLDGVLEQTGKLTCDFGSYKNYITDSYEVNIDAGAHVLTIRPVLVQEELSPPPGVDDRIDEANLVAYFYNS